MHKKMQQDNIIYEGGAVRNAWILFDFREVSGSIYGNANLKIWSFEDNESVIGLFWLFLSERALNIQREIQKLSVLSYGVTL